MKLEDLVLKYGVIGGIRYTEKDKLNFLTNIKEDFEDCGYEFSVLRKDFKRFSGINAYIGDVANSKNLIIANYDTPKNSFNADYKYLPFNHKLSERELHEKTKLKAMRVILIGAIVLFLGVMYLPFNETFKRIFAVVVTVLMTSGAYIILRGRPNTVNANLNTSGVLGLLELAKSKPKDTAFILTDRAFVDNLGDVMVTEALPKSLSSKNVIYLNAIGRGSDVVISYKENNQLLAKKVANGSKNVKFFELDDNGLIMNPLKYYDNGIMISVADTFNDTFEISDVCSDNDVNIDEEKFYFIINLLKNYL